MRKNSLDEARGVGTHGGVVPAGQPSMDRPWEEEGGEQICRIVVFHIHMEHPHKNRERGQRTRKGCEWETDVSVQAPQSERTAES